MRDFTRLNKDLKLFTPGDNSYEYSISLGLFLITRIENIH